ncbi:MAG: hypothetical protein P4M14_01970 [Gammaproteobacteria bacterium]|nr:hypothetical protein [Gammaproteobacteria bacterium]
MQSQKAKENLRNKKEELIKQIRVLKRKLAEIRESDIQKSSQFDQEFTQSACQACPDTPRFPSQLPFFII